METKKEVSEGIKDTVRIVKKHGKYGLSCGNDDNFVVRPMYDFAQHLGEFIKLGRRVGDKMVYGLFSPLYGRQIIEDVYEEIDIKYANLTPVGDKIGMSHILAKVDGKYCVFGIKGQRIVPPFYQSIVDNVHFVCDIHSGKQLIPPGEPIPQAQYFIAKDSGVAHLYNMDGTILVIADKIIPAGIDTFIYYKNGKQGIYTSKGKIRPADYDDIIVIEDVIAVSMEGGGELLTHDLESLLITFGPIKLASTKPLLFKATIGKETIRFNKFGRVID